ncbi:hypothetical protein STAS_19055 [Striga asiatica]|uniref:Uncharacterized protein n=1 Tax=Striga asiatica TaxID=4170 RepID=A0A5A7QBA7_STRAF|nr:hypothetical protein STAS_19055 [Striga asiatica]
MDKDEAEGQKSQTRNMKKRKSTKSENPVHDNAIKRSRSTNLSSVQRERPRNENTSPAQGEKKLHPLKRDSVTAAADKGLELVCPLLRSESLAEDLDMNEMLGPSDKKG